MLTILKFNSNLNIFRKFYNSGNEKPSRPPKTPTYMIFMQSKSHNTLIITGSEYNNFLPRCSRHSSPACFVWSYCCCSSPSSPLPPPASRCHALQTSPAHPLDGDGHVDHRHPLPRVRRLVLPLLLRGTLGSNHIPIHRRIGSWNQDHVVETSDDSVLSTSGSYQRQ